ncbi:Hypothetical predicted protein, partial [Mytilus galloprovincialis]
AHAVNENCTCYFEVDGKKIESFLCDIEHVCTADNPIYPCEYPLPCQEQKCAKYPAAKCYMDREDRRRYFIVGSVILEVVTPLFWKRIENEYTNCGLASLQDFLNKQSTIHILFHLRHRNTWCCKDKTNCSNNGALPLNYCQWDLSYTETHPSVNPHGCHFKFSANPVQLDNLDITLASLILLNCCNLTPDEKAAIQKLRQYKNDYLSHNIKGTITKREYKSLWADLTNFILQLDSSKQDDMTRIEARPLDEALCSRYCLNLIDVHKRLDQIDNTMKIMNNSVKDSLQNVGSSVQGSLQNMETSILVEIFLIKRQSHRLGQCKFTIYRQIDLSSVPGDENRRVVSDLVMMDDARLGNPCYVTAVNITTVAVTLEHICSIEMYDINSKLKLKSISVHEMCYKGITTINKNLVVCGANRLLFIYHHTEEVVKTTHTECYPLRLYNSGDRLFYSSVDVEDSKLYWYSFTDDTHQYMTLPSKPSWMTTLRDGSMYVMCTGGSVIHVSSDGKQHENVTGLCLGNDNVVISYNGKQKKLVTINKEQRFARGVAVQIFKEI